MTKENIKTKQDLIDAGYKPGATAWTRGYVTRKPRDPRDVFVGIGGGRRKGMYYVVEPSWQSTMYCVRVYYA